MSVPDNQTIEAWINLVRAYHLTFSNVESALKDADFPSLSWYDVLLELDRVGADGLRPFELQAKVLLPQYGVSRLIARIENAGYLERVSCDNDGRGQHLKITKSGKTLRKKMWRVYGEVLQNKIGQKITEKQATELAATLKNIVQESNG